MERDKLVLTKDEAQDIVFEDNKKYKTIKNNIIDTTRWSEVHHIVVQRVSDGKYFADTYSQGLTENQDESPYDYLEPSFSEVFPVEKTIISYE